ncbi:peroxidase-like, partial [Daktulosphaira vitifoliae]|uniref:peroxidase-like n=1 Tax=Daktulosphaira vitifoliae TaxID=58002 RepID=UPI0021AA92BB
MQRLIVIFILMFLNTSRAQSLFLNTNGFSVPNCDHIAGEQCNSNIVCDVNAKYRTIDGLCNNLNVPWWGAANTSHLRHVYPFYGDGIYSFRKQIDGSPLPGARLINLKLFLNKQFPSWNEHNTLFMEWGQFVAHDTTDLPPDPSITGGCCLVRNKYPIQCQYVINVPLNDPVYSKFGQTCINFVRAITMANMNNSSSIPASFPVMSTHYMDGSQIYGSNKQLASELRTFQDGRLRSEFNNNHQEFCPQRSRTSSQCESSSDSQYCFLAGDRRINQNLGIAVFQTMFLKFHNVIAQSLQTINPHWDDEKLYQETRRFIIATIQHINYAYYLPILLGKDFTAKHGFNKPAVYDENLDPSTAQEHSTGAFRVLHKEIPEFFNLISKNMHNVQHAVITEWLDKPDLLPYNDNYDNMIRGLMESSTRQEQPSYNPLISNNLFLKTKPKFSGNDLLAIDIQRERDTGMPPYNTMRSICGIPAASSFDDLLDLIPYDDVQKLKELYFSVNDIDFIVGALLEIPAKGAKVGPTSRSILAESFYRYKNGDRFFYDVLGQPGSFTSEQLKVIKSITFGHVICATSSIKHVPYDI